MGQDAKSCFTSKGLLEALDWETYTHPHALYSVRYPVEWKRIRPLSDGACLAIAYPAGDILVEAFAINTSRQPGPLRAILKALKCSLRNEHPELEVKSNQPFSMQPPDDKSPDAPAELGLPENCRRMVCTYRDPVQFTQECYVMNRGNLAICLNFEVPSSEYSDHDRTFAQVACSVRMADDG